MQIRCCPKHAIPSSLLLSVDRLNSKEELKWKLLTLLVWGLDEFTCNTQLDPKYIFYYQLMDGKYIIGHRLKES